MKNIQKVLVVVFVLAGLQINFAQSATEPSPKPTPPIPIPEATTKTGEAVSINLEKITAKTPVTRERREQCRGVRRRD